ncbi:MAG: hypothetical protein KGI19_07405, partial [Thaumarchaeota archaeon]|nr:hypothetical protein [Nitrososphaerota archaeon]
SAISNAGRLLSPSDTVALSEISNTASSKNKILVESITSSDTVSASIGKATTMTESLTVSGILGGKTIGKSLSELVDVSTSLTAIGAHEYLITNQTQITVNPAKPNLVVANSNASLSSIIVPSSVSNPTLNYGSIQQSNGSVNVENAL